MTKRLFVYFLLALCYFAGRADEPLKADIASASVRVGDVFEVAITLNDTSTADAIDWDITYDPAILTAIEIKPGPASAGWEFYSNPNQTGLASIAQFTIDRRTGGGIMAWITFIAIAPGITPLSLWCSVNEGWVPVTVTPGAVAVGYRVEVPHAPRVPHVHAHIGSDL